MISIPALLAEPVGVLIGMFIPGESVWTEGILLSMVAGAFLYIGATETIVDELETTSHDGGCDHGSALTRTHAVPDKRHRLWKFGCMIAGVATMAVANIGLAKGHAVEHGRH